MIREIAIVTPSGERMTLPVESRDAGVRLSAWLERRRIPLNTRCGQMGLCRGCLVELETPGETTAERSCRLTLDALPAGLLALRVPESSWRDQGLNGVSAFEVHAGFDWINSREGLGLAVDVGTTTVAAALWDLADGKCLGTATTGNAQGRFGDNVVTRIHHACAAANGSRDLQAAIVSDTWIPLMEQVCAQAGVAGERIVEAVATGNTAMLHALAGAPLNGLAKYPFQPAFLGATTWPARGLGLPGDFPVRAPACLGPFVGADVTAGALACGLMAAPGPALLIDFGTNGEILLKHPDGFLAAATAAGPAFEGGRLTCGATAGPGVISHLRRSEDGWTWIDSAGEAPRNPRGISGAAYVDFMAEARAAGLLNDMGRLMDDHPEVLMREGERLVPLTKGVSAGESDIAEIIQAKAAITGGVMTLLERAGLTVADLETIYIAGGFGYHLDIDHAIAVGLLPNAPRERFTIVGNASLGGASLLLLSGDSTPLAPLLDSCLSLELNRCPSFEDHFIDGMALSPCE